MSVETIRMLERLLATFFGGMSLYFGFQLFLKGILGESSSDWAAFGVKIKITKAAPGIFFALFGATILVFSLAKPIRVESFSPNPEQPAVQETGSSPILSDKVSFFGATDDQDLLKELQTLNLFIAGLQNLSGGISLESRDETFNNSLLENLQRLKKRLIHTVVSESDLNFYDQYSPTTLNTLSGQNQHRWHTIDRLINGMPAKE